MDRPQEYGKQMGQCAKKENLIRENSENREEKEWDGKEQFCLHCKQFSLMGSQKDFHS
jgi:hypothetical protein